MRYTQRQRIRSPMNRIILVIGIPLVLLGAFFLLSSRRAPGPVSNQQAPTAEEATLLQAPEGSRKYVDLANYYRTQERWKDSEAMSRKAIELDPTSDMPYIQLGNLYRYQKRFDDAVAIIQKLLTVNPNSDWAYVVLGNTYRDQGNTEQAIAMFEKAVALSPKQYQAYKELGRTYLTTNDPKQAEAMFLKAVEVEPNPQEPDNAYLDLVSLYESQGRTNDAKRMRAKATSLTTPTPPR